MARTQKLVTVTRRTRGAEEMIQSALERGRYVMARALNGVWFRAVCFHEELVDPLHPEWGKVWWAGSSTGNGNHRNTQVRTINWFEKVETVSPQQY